MTRFSPIRCFALPSILGAVIFLMIGMGLLGIDREAHAIAFILSAIFLIGVGLALMSTIIFLSNMRLYKTHNKSFGMNKIGITTLDDGKGYYIVNQTIAGVLALSGFGLISVILFALFQIYTGEFVLGD